MRVLVVTNLYPTPKRPFLSPFVKEQVESIRIRYPNVTIDVRVLEGDRPRWVYLRDILLLPRVVKRGRYDIVHAHFGLTLISTLLVRAPIVITFHGSDLLVTPTKYISRILAPTASQVIVVAHKLREYLGYGEVIPCGIEVNRFTLPKSFTNRTSPTTPGSIKVLFPSDPARAIKDYGLFKAVCMELEARGNQVEEVHLVNVARDRVRDLYWECDIMLLTSLSEGSPTVIKEAIAAKLPFVSVDVGDVKEWATRIQFGVVVSGREPKPIANAVTNLLSTIKHRALLDNSDCLTSMDTSNIAKKIMSLYEKILQKDN